MAIFEIKKLSWLFLELCVKSWLFLNFSLIYISNSSRNQLVDVRERAVYHPIIVTIAAKIHLFRLIFPLNNPK
jgi:hypothetical protein